jgi:ABC-type branched-subunit amino acid transport system substrate-binding protein
MNGRSNVTASPVNRVRPLSRALLALTCTALAIAGCGGSTATSGHGTLDIAGFVPFTGPDAPFGPELMAGCATAITAVNRAGGVLGHHLACVATDTRGDPADAAPAASQLIATHSNLVGVLGPTSDEADATIPIFDQAKIPMFVDTGEPRYDHTTVPYFWRLFPPDNAQGEVMALWAHHQGYKRGAAVFGTDISSQSNVPVLTSTFSRVGGAIAANERLALDQSSYQTEVEKMVGTNPQVIMSEADPQTDATFLAELKQLHGLIPIIGTDVTLAFRHAVSLAIGSANLQKYWTGIQPYAPTSGPAWSAFNSTLLTLAAKVPKPSQWSSDTYSIRPYDAVVIMALAMTAAHSTSPSVYNADVKTVTAAGPGKTVVYTYPQGVAALKQGKHIQFIGAGGPIEFDQWHNAAGAFEAVRYTGHTNIVAGKISSKEISQFGGA